jgi:hypothetical protein
MLFSTSMICRLRFLIVLTGTATLLTPHAAWSMKPEYSITDTGVRIANVTADCPVIYDNDFWVDVPDAAYIWAKASLGECNLRGNIVTRCTFGWRVRYAHELAQQVEEAQRLLRLAQDSGLTNIPELTIGSTVALQPPASGKIEDTQFERSAGSELIVQEARKASPERPLLVFVGGSCTTVASAYLSDPSIANRIVVFQIDGGVYNGSDEWAWKITMERCRFVNWARGYFWDRVHEWNPARFDDLPRNPLCDLLREYAHGDLAKSNQWGDGAWIFQLYAPQCVTKLEDYDGQAVTVPRDGTNIPAIEQEFFQTMHDPKLFSTE